VSASVAVAVACAVATFVAVELEVGPFVEKGYEVESESSGSRSSSNLEPNSSFEGIESSSLVVVVGSQGGYTKAVVDLKDKMAVVGSADCWTSRGDSRGSVQSHSLQNPEEISCCSSPRICSSDGSSTTVEKIEN